MRISDWSTDVCSSDLADDNFKSRSLYPNVDFYSGIIYKALGIPVNMFTPMFAIARTVGWAAHWIEMVSDPTLRIARPRQVYTGAVERHVSALVTRCSLRRQKSTPTRRVYDRNRGVEGRGG